jgi:lysophospholipase L1-like esterase
MSKKVFLASDSTVQAYDTSEAPQAGWGMFIQNYFTQDVIFANHSIGGRSSRSFIEEGRLDAILNVICKDDYLFVQMGHNDATKDRPLRYTEPYGNYKDFLRKYINGARTHGAEPVLITPVGRFHYENCVFINDFADYCAAMKQVAEEMDVPLIDLMQKSLDLYSRLGPDETKKMFMVSHNGTDYTHFTIKGANSIAALVAEGVRELGIDISGFVKKI